MTAVGDKYKAKISTLPPASRCVGSSVALCFFSAISTFAAKDSSHDSFIKGSSVSFIFITLFIAGILMDTMFRVGNTSSERGKIGFNEKLIKEIKEENMNIANTFEARDIE